MTPRIQELLHRIDFGAGDWSNLPEILRLPRGRARHAAMVRVREAGVSGVAVELFLAAARLLDRLDPDALGMGSLVELDRLVGGTGSIEPALAIGLLDLIQGKCPDYFVHPAFRALLIHACVSDGGLFGERSEVMARLFVRWFMRKSGYVIFDHLELFRAGNMPAGTDDEAQMDWLSMIWRAIDVLRQTQDIISETPSTRDAPPSTVQGFNPRQRDVLALVEKSPGRELTIASHQSMNRIAYATARADLYGLRDAGFLAAKKRGKAWVFLPRKDAGTFPNAKSSSSLPQPARDWRVW